MPSRGWQIFFGIVVAIGGGVLVWAPFDSIAVLALTAGCALIVIGLLEMITAFRVRRSTAEVRDKMTGLHASASEFRSSRGDLAKGA
ncbi:DUF308 domain-containing protein [Nocardia seriolae]|nr:DUF308 domain-containing protein [Nocardia seriolae]